MAKGLKTGGRTTGTPNKLTFQTRQLLVNVLAQEFENLPETLTKLTPAEKIDAICKLSKYALPTMEAFSSVRAEIEGQRDEAEVIEEIIIKNKENDTFCPII
jgi:hypothetical protein